MHKFEQLIEDIKRKRTTRLDLSGFENIEDLTPLMSLSHLTRLKLGSCFNIRDIRSLSSLINLRYLDLSNYWNLEDLTPLSSLSGLTELLLKNCGSVKDIHALSSLVKLTRLNLQNCKNVKNAAPLGALTSLTELVLSGCWNIRDISCLGSLKYLKKLDLEDCWNIEDIRVLSSLTQLTDLNLRDCRKIKDFSSLCYLPDLDLEKLVLPVNRNIEDILPNDLILHSHQDDQGRFHHETGPSISYKGGLNLYHWHGVRIPREWITTKPPSPKEALSWKNMEQRWAACEIIGWKNIICELDAKVINENPDPEIGTLLEVGIPNFGRNRFLRVRCGTGREFVLAVPPTMRTARQANAWTWGLDEDDYYPEIRT